MFFFSFPLVLWHVCARCGVGAAAAEPPGASLRSPRVPCRMPGATSSVSCTEPAPGSPLCPPCVGQPRGGRGCGAGCCVEAAVGAAGQVPDLHGFRSLKQKGGGTGRQTRELVNDFIHIRTAELLTEIKLRNPCVCPWVSPSVSCPFDPYSDIFAPREPGQLETPDSGP